MISAGIEDPYFYFPLKTCTLTAQSTTGKVCADPRTLITCDAPPDRGPSDLGFYGDPESIRHLGPAGKYSQGTILIMRASKTRAHLKILRIVGGGTPDMFEELGNGRCCQLQGQVSDVQNVAAEENRCPAMVPHKPVRTGRREHREFRDSPRQLLKPPPHGLVAIVSRPGISSQPTYQARRGVLCFYIYICWSVSALVVVL